MQSKYSLRGDAILDTDKMQRWGWECWGTVYMDAQAKWSAYVYNVSTSSPSCLTIFMRNQKLCTYSFLTFQEEMVNFWLLILMMPFGVSLLSPIKRKEVSTLKTCLKNNNFVMCCLIRHSNLYPTVRSRSLCQAQFVSVWRWNHLHTMLNHVFLILRQLQR